MKNRLGNPAVATALLNSDIVKEQARAKTEVISKTLPFVLKTLFFVGLAGFAYYKFTHRFSSLATNKNYEQSNISDNQAKAKAESLYNAMFGIGNGFEIVKAEIAGLNYNGFVKVYNAFGERKGANDVFNKTNLIEWLHDQFSSYELEQLRFLVPNVFRQTN